MVPWDLVAPTPCALTRIIDELVRDSFASAFVSDGAADGYCRRSIAHIDYWRRQSLSDIRSCRFSRSRATCSLMSRPVTILSTTCQLPVAGLSDPRRTVGHPHNARFG